MTAELGHLALALALVVAALLGVLPFVIADAQRACRFAVVSARVQLLLLLLAFSCLTTAFINNDFSLLYVARHSNSMLPLLYRIAGVWGAHEGSLLLWALILAGWTAAFSFSGDTVPALLKRRVLAILGLVSSGFLSFTLLTSNPFLRLLPPAPEGRDLNPLLQDFGLAVHPPILYMGYVGLAIAFAFAVAALLERRPDPVWTSLARPWTAVSWTFLTLGIALGSWWAYYELGWGGWWFWDPVENASFMPWLIGTALIHSLLVTSRRKQFHSLALLLAISGFSLSLLGTFLVRSGVLTSVHAFANDPQRGLFILLLLALAITPPLFLYAWRAPSLQGKPASFSWLSRDSALLLNNLLLLVLTATVLLGTLYPLIIDVLGLGKLSVGAPFFNLVFVPLALPLLALAGLASLMRWQSDEPRRLWQRYRLWWLLIAVTALAIPAFFPPYRALASIGLLAGLWLLLSSLLQLRQGWPRKGLPPWSQWAVFWGHLGMAVFALGVTITSVYQQQKEVELGPNESYLLGRYQWTMHGTKNRDGPNYDSLVGHLEVRSSDADAIALYPEKRRYRASGSTMTEAAIDGGFWRDLFVALGEQSEQSEQWSMRLQYKPLIRWIWLGAILMAIGGLCAAMAGRRRQDRP